MPNTYTQIYVHIIFAVKKRQNLISKEWRDNLYKYITGIISNKNQKLMIINGMPDHLHILISLGTDCRITDLVRDIKANSSKWINENKFVLGKFEWQNGFGAFSISKSQIDKVVNYIKNQEEHHKIKSFKEEYIEILDVHQINYKLEYIFNEDGID
ncbi:MAG: IS200/IS605 family transposase [Bacteroidota bacterium]|nr:IS200/IS605 family transposase [Bacteroidota bacterium]